MPRVLLTTCCPHWPYARQTPGQLGVWDEFEFVIDQQNQECDAWVVFDNPIEQTQAKCNPENTFFITAEPPGIRTYRSDFLSQFRWVLSSHTLRHRGGIDSIQYQPWHVGVDCERNFEAKLDFDELTEMPRPDKPFLISAAISNKEITEGHRLRLEFVRQLKQRLGDQLHVWGQGHRPIGDKWEAVAPYRFHLALENTRRRNYVTEKIGDAFLGRAFPFYFGADNVSDYFPDDSFEPIDLQQPALAVDKVLAGIELQLDVQRQASLEVARTAVLNELNLFPALARILRERMVGGTRSEFCIHTKSQHVRLALSNLRRAVTRAA